MLLRVSTPYVGHNSFAWVFEFLSTKKGMFEKSNTSIPFHPYSFCKTFCLYQKGQEYFKMLMNLSSLLPHASWSLKKGVRLHDLHPKRHYGSYHKHLENEHKRRPKLPKPFPSVWIHFLPLHHIFPMTEMHGVAMSLEIYSLAWQNTHDKCAFPCQAPHTSPIW